MEAKSQETDAGKEAVEDKDDIRAAQMALGIKEETSEHSWLSKDQVKRLVSDHLALDPEYYDAEEED